MKLKLRLFVILISATLITASLLITVTTYFFTSDYYPIHKDVHGVVTVTGEGKFRQNRLFKELNRIVPSTLAREGKSTQIKLFNELKEIETSTTKNSRIEKWRDKFGQIPKKVNFNDSNQAAEVELSQKENTYVYSKKHILRPSTSPDNKTMNRQPSKKEIKSRFIRECVNLKVTPDPDDDREGFEDLVKILQEEKVSAEKLGQAYHKKRKTIQDIHGIKVTGKITLMDYFHLGISDLDLYREEDMLIPKLLKEMSTSEIVHVGEKSGGSQLKLTITYHDGSQSMMKPMRFDRDKETLPDHFYFVDFERHNAEIAAFHLDRILGFRRCPPVVGRVLNITTEIYPLAEEEIIKTFFVSPAQNYCFHGECSYYCDTSHAICGHPDDLEGSFAAFLPPDSLSKRKSWKNPWRRSYHKRKKAKWETDDDYCDTVRQSEPYKNSKRLADLIDTTIFDFLTGNMDRHHYETLRIFGNESYILHLDNGRGFGKSKHDEMSILAPLIQCCFIHMSTFERLLQLQLNPMRLSTLMRCSMYYDPINPILNDAHLAALDRRLQIVLKVLRECLTQKGRKRVFYHRRKHSD